MKNILFICTIVLLALPASSQTTGPFSLVQPDTLVKDTSIAIGGGPNQGDENKIRIVKRKINYGEFVALGIGTMIFVALVITTTQAWNPGARNP